MKKEEVSNEKRAINEKGEQAADAKELTPEALRQQPTRSETQAGEQKRDATEKKREATEPTREQDVVAKHVAQEVPAAGNDPAREQEAVSKEPVQERTARERNEGKQASTHAEPAGSMPSVRKQPVSARERLRHAHARRAELATHVDGIRSAADRDIAALRERVRMAEAQAEASIADARRQEQELHDELASSVASDFYTSIDPLVASWCEEPKRATARAIADTFATFDNRSIQELGTPLWELAIAYSFAEYILKSKPSAVNAFGETNLGQQSVIELSGSFRRAIATGITSVETFLEDLEHLLEVSAGLPACALDPNPNMVERFRTARTCATHGLAMTRLGAVDAAESARRQRAAQQQIEASRLRDEEEQKRQLGYAGAPVYFEVSGTSFSENDVRSGVARSDWRTAGDPSLFQSVVRAARELLP